MESKNLRRQGNECPRSRLPNHYLYKNSTDNLNNYTILFIVFQFFQQKSRPEGGRLGLFFEAFVEAGGEVCADGLYDADDCNQHHDGKKHDGILIAIIALHDSHVA